MLPDLSGMSSKSIREFVSKNPYENPGPRDKEENRTIRKSISYSELYYRMCHESTSLPTQREYAEVFVDICGSEISDRKEKVVKKRVERNWPTLTMELDFYCQARDSKLFDKVEIDTELDVKLGYDLIVIDETDGYFDVVPVHLFFATKEEQRWQSKKEERKKGKPKGLEFGLMPSWISSHAEKTVPDIPGKRIGNVHFYTQKHLKRFKNKVDKWKKKKDVVHKCGIAEISLEASSIIESSRVYKKYLKSPKQNWWHVRD